MYACSSACEYVYMCVHACACVWACVFAYVSSMHGVEVPGADSSALHGLSLHSCPLTSLVVSGTWEA